MNVDRPRGGWGPVGSGQSTPVAGQCSRPEMRRCCNLRLNRSRRAHDAARRESRCCAPAGGDRALGARSPRLCHPDAEGRPRRLAARGVAGDRHGTGHAGRGHPDRRGVGSWRWQVGAGRLDPAVGHGHAPGHARRGDRQHRDATSDQDLGRTGEVAARLGIPSVVRIHLDGAHVARCGARPDLAARSRALVGHQCRGLRRPAQSRQAHHRGVRRGLGDSRRDLGHDRGRAH